MLPIIGAVGGMLIPALFYVFINWGNSETMNGWAIPSATDIAFSLGILSLLGSRVPMSLKVFLTALAIIDDLGGFLFIGLLMWFFTYKSGIHATIAGVLLASTIPHRLKDKDFSLLMTIEHSISPYVAFLIMPLFAFANAGVNLEGLSLSSLMSPVPLGILCGLFFGKQIGVLLFSYAVSYTHLTLPTILLV